MIFKGSGVALITPFDKYNHINYEKLEELIEFQITNLSDAIIICGTTGESSTLSNDEKKEVIKFTVDKVNKRIPVIAGTGSNNTNISIEMSRYAEYVGVDGVLLVTPYYNKCTQEGLFLHYKTIANNITIPIIMYNVPSRTSVNISANTTIRLSKIDNIVGIKEASSNIAQISQIISNTDDNFSVYSGNDDQILPLLSLGGSGVISVLANILPEETHSICQNYFEGNIENSRILQFKYLNLINKLFSQVNPIPIKEAMNILNYKVGNCRLPLSPMEETAKQELKSELKKLFHI